MACRFFLAGHCRLGSRCRHQHLSPPVGQDFSVLRAGAASSLGPEMNADVVAPPSSSSSAVAAVPQQGAAERPECTLLSLALCDGDTEDLECCICFDLLADPRQCRNGHACCLACLTRHLEVSQTCPTCRTSMQLEAAGRNLQLERQISALRFRCKNAGCPATFVRVEREAHEQECQYRLVECVCRCRVAVHIFYSHLQTCTVWRDVGRLAEEAARATRQVAELQAEVMRLQTDLDSRVKDADAALRHAEDEVSALLAWKEATKLELGRAQEAAHAEQSKFSTMLDSFLKEFQKQPKANGKSLESKQQAILSHIRTLKQALQTAEENAQRVSAERVEKEHLKFSGILEVIAGDLRNIGGMVDEYCTPKTVEEMAYSISTQIESLESTIRSHDAMARSHAELLEREAAALMATKEELSRSVPRQQLEEEQGKFSGTLDDIMKELRPCLNAFMHKPQDMVPDPVLHDLGHKQAYIMSQIQELERHITSTKDELQRERAAVAATRAQLSRSVPMHQLTEEQFKFSSILGDILREFQCQPRYGYAYNEDKKNYIVTQIRQLQQTIRRKEEELSNKCIFVAAMEQNVRTLSFELEDARKNYAVCCRQQQQLQNAGPCTYHCIYKLPTP